MNKSGALKIGNSLLGLAFLGQITTILVFELAFEEGSEGASFLGLSPHDWMETHEVIGFSLIALGVFHVVLNWGWVRSNLFGGRKT